MAALAVAFFFLFAAACASREDVDRPPERAACERYREHLIDLRIEGVTEDVEAHRAAIAASLPSDVVDRCVAESDPAEIECLTHAATLDAARACSKEP